MKRELWPCRLFLVEAADYADGPIGHGMGAIYDHLKSALSHAANHPAGIVLSNPKHR